MEGLDQHQVPPLTVLEWLHARQAFNLPVLVAVRCMLEDFDSGHIAAEERHRNGIPVQ